MGVEETHRHEEGEDPPDEHDEENDDVGVRYAPGFLGRELSDSIAHWGTSSA